MILQIRQKDHYIEEKRKFIGLIKDELEFYTLRLKIDSYLTNGGDKNKRVKDTRNFAIKQT